MILLAPCAYSRLFDLKGCSHVGKRLGADGYISIRHMLLSDHLGRDSKFFGIVACL